MIVYQHTVGEFIKHCLDERSIGHLVKDEMIKRGLTLFSKSSEKSWEKSLPEVAKVLKHGNIASDIDVAVEYKIRQNDTRIDFLIYGYDDFNNENMVIVELKQWSSVNPCSAEYKVNALVAKGVIEDHFHPSYQAKNYIGQLKSFNEYVQVTPVQLNACSYLHNMNSGYSGLLKNVALFPFLTDTPSYLQDDQDRLEAFIKKYVSKKCHEILYSIDQSRIVPSAQLGDMLDKCLKGNDLYSLDDGQAYSLSAIVQEAKDALYYDEKRVIIVRGGAGTGKSIVALNALGKLIKGKSKKDSYNAFYVTANAAPKKVYFKALTKLDYSKKDLRDLFKYPTVFKGEPSNSVDCALIDEAHRVFKWNAFSGPKGTDILEEIIRVCRVSVFFIDENQSVTKDDYATVDRIKALAAKHKKRVIEKGLELKGQYRVMGGEEYISFIKGFLGIEAPKPFNVNKSYICEVFRDPNKMWEVIREKDKEYRLNVIAQEGKLPTAFDDICGKSRMVAGYTYPWTSSETTRDGQYDILIPKDNFRAKWNLRQGSGLDAYSWADDPDSINEIGCIHTCQGLDLDYCGVIIGKDIIYRDGKIQFHKEEHPKTDQSGIRTVPDEQAQMLIKNTYYVLLTRGIKGTFIYCEDDALRDYLLSLGVPEHQ